MKAQKRVHLAISFVLVVSALGLISGGRAYADDIYEPNDGFAEAASIASGTYEGLYCESGDPDFFHIYVTENRSVTVKITFVHANGNLDLVLFNTRRETIDKGMSTTDNETVFVKDTGHRNYYVKVKAPEQETANTYDMTISVDDNYEQNDSFDTAVPMSLGIYEDLYCESGDLDFFKIDIPENRSVTVKITFVHANGNLDLFILNSNREELDEGKSTTDNETVLVRGIPARSYYIKVKAPGQETANTYDMTISIDDNYEENDGFDTAVPISEGIYEDLCCDSGDPDFYSINVCENETVAVTISITEGLLDLFAYDLRQELVDSSESSYKTETVVLRHVPAGTYVVEVRDSVYHYTMAHYAMRIRKIKYTAGKWTQVDRLAWSQSNHTATLLTDGRVLVAGYYGAEIYDPSNGSWTKTDGMDHNRSFHTATLLPDGKVLVVGGAVEGAKADTAEVYDPDNGTWDLIEEPLDCPRSGHTATLLPNGKVLVVGGNSGGECSSAEVYDPEQRSWQSIEDPEGTRFGGGATLLPNGKVLVVGGITGVYDPEQKSWKSIEGPAHGGSTATLLWNGEVLVVGGFSAEVYGPDPENPDTWIWTPTGDLNFQRTGHTATLMPNGTVVVTGGYGDHGQSASVEVYDPETRTWLDTDSLGQARAHHTATLLPGGKLLVAGGNEDSSWNYSSDSAEIFEFPMDDWADTGSLNQARHYHTATLLENGDVLAAGGVHTTALTIGNQYDMSVNTAEIYSYQNRSWKKIEDENNMMFERGSHTATLLTDGTVLVAGGTPDAANRTAELFDPHTKSWKTAGNLRNGRFHHTATLLADGRVLLAGGSYYSSYAYNEGNYDPAASAQKSAEVYDAVTGTWTLTSPMNYRRMQHTATLLPDGRVLVAGGYSEDRVSETTEVYGPNPANQDSWIWTKTSNLYYGHWQHTATLLPNGTVLVAGGSKNDEYVPTGICEIYHPSNGAWTVTGSLNKERNNHAAVLLSDGRVLVAGGFDGEHMVDTAEVYDPEIGTWTEIGNLSHARMWHPLTLMPDNMILVCGGWNWESLPFSELLGGLADRPSWFPNITSFSSILETGATLALTGSGFRHIYEGSSGSTQNSATNYPLVQLRRIEGGQTRWLGYDRGWGTDGNISDTSLTTKPITDFPDGHALVTVFSNSAASEAVIIQINNPPTVVAILRPDGISPATKNASVAFEITFSEPVTGVDTGDFELSENLSVEGSTIESIKPTGGTGIKESKEFATTYEAIVTGCDGQGTLRLDMIDDDSIQDIFSASLGGAGVGNGNYEGPRYDIDRIAPFLAGVRVQPDGLSIDVTFSEHVGDSAATASNYTISDNGQGNLSTHPDRVEHLHSNTYRLVWDPLDPADTGQHREMLNGGDVAVTVSNVEDVVGNAIDEDLNSDTHSGAGIGIAPTTVASPGSGTYDVSQLVELECEDQDGSGCAATHYSTDGSEPSTPYAGPVLIDRYTELKFFSVDNAGNAELTRTQVYYINIPSTISCELSQPSIIFGESLRVAGQLEPPPNEAGRGVDVAFIHIDGPSLSFPAHANGLGEFTLDLDCSEITAAGSWTVQVSWAGDESHLGATSTPQSLTVVQAASSLTLDIVMSEAIKVNTEPPIGGKFSTDPYCDHEYLEPEDSPMMGTPIILHITEPDGATENEVHVTTNEHGHFLLDYGVSGFAFNKVGEWTILAEFVGNDDYLQASSDPIKVRVVPTSGYAVLVQGKSDSEEGLASHSKTMNFVYEQLIERQLLPDDIEYFGWDILHPGWDGFPSKADIETAITQTSMDNMIANPGDLYIVMVDHGWTSDDDEEGIFYMDPDDPITSSDLSTWLDGLQEGLFRTAAEDRRIVVVLGFCRAGAFIEAVSGENRTIIASAAANEYSHRGAQDVDDRGQPLRDGEYFVSEFFKTVAYGKSVSQCFEQATTLTEAFTSSGSGGTNAPYFDDSLQHPLLDDNGDGLGSNVLSSQEGEDGYASQVLFIGTSPNAGNDPGDVLVTDVAEEQFLDLGDSSVNVWAKVDQPERVRMIWLEVKAPDYDLGDPGEGQQIEMVTVRKGTIDKNDDVFVWHDLGADEADLFSTPGTYQVFYFAKDDETGHVSPLKESKVHKALTGNAPPDPFLLVAPDDEAEVLTTVVLDWEDTTDPDGDPVTYTVLLSEGDSSFADPIRKEGLRYSACLVDPNDGIRDLCIYYWKVQAIDQYGEIQETGVRSFKTDNTNPLAAWVDVRVYDTATGELIKDANVMIGTMEFDLPRGKHICEVPPGQYKITVSAVGYASKSCSREIDDSATIRLDFGLGSGDDDPGGNDPEDPEDPEENDDSHGGGGGGGSCFISSAANDGASGILIWLGLLTLGLGVVGLSTSTETQEKWLQKLDKASGIRHESSIKSFG